MSTDDRMETITDPALIRATDEPDERGDFPCCTTPAPVSGAGLDLDASHVRTDPACTFHDGTTPPASRGKRCPACMRLDLDAMARRYSTATDDEVIYEMYPALEAEVGRLTEDIDQCWVPLYHDTKHERDQAEARAEAAEAEVVTLRAKVAAVVDEYPHADTCGSMLTPGAGYPCSCWQADLRAALATTGEGQ